MRHLPSPSWPNDRYCGSNESDTVVRPVPELVPVPVCEPVGSDAHVGQLFQANVSTLIVRSPNPSLICSVPPASTMSNKLYSSKPVARQSAFDGTITLKMPSASSRIMVAFIVFMIVARAEVL